MIRRLREFSAALIELLQGVVGLLSDIRDVLQAHAPETIEPRVDAIERRMALWEAEVEATMQKAIGERKNARNAEERARAMLGNVRSAASDEGSLEDIPEEYLRFLRPSDGEAGSEEGVSPVRVSVGDRRAEQKRRANRLKFGG